MLYKGRADLGRLFRKIFVIARKDFFFLNIFLNYRLVNFLLNILIIYSLLFGININVKK